MLNLQTTESTQKIWDSSHYFIYNHLTALECRDLESVGITRFARKRFLTRISSYDFVRFGCLEKNKFTFIQSSN